MVNREATGADPRRPRIFYGWWMVAITSAMAFFASGIFFRGFTVFVPAIRDSLGISQAQTNLIFSIARAEGGLEGPVAGWLIDRFGNRKLLVPAILWAVAGYLVLSQFVDSFLTFTLVYLLMVSLGNSIAFQHALFAGINQWFNRRRAFAISMLAAVSSLGGLFLAPSLNWIMERGSWQDAMRVSGIVYLAFLMPLTIFFRNRPEDMGLLPDGDARPPVLAGPGREAPGQAREIRDYTVREALRTRAYWLLLAGAGRDLGPGNEAQGAGGHRLIYLTFLAGWVEAEGGSMRYLSSFEEGAGGRGLVNGAGIGARTWNIRSGSNLRRRSTVRRGR